MFSGEFPLNPLKVRFLVGDMRTAQKTQPSDSDVAGPGPALLAAVGAYGGAGDGRQLPRRADGEVVP